MARSKFITGPEVNPFARASVGMSLLESITAPELASAVPIVKITKIDNRTGAPDTSHRPLMFDLIQTPQFAGMQDDLSFRERSMVSLVSLNIDTNLSYGFMMWRKVTLDFIVHQPALVFDRDSRIPWRELLEVGNSFSLEYGWNGAIPNPTTQRVNPLFDGLGYSDNRTGLVVPSTETILLVVYQYSTRLTANGEVSLTINALENGDIALREARFSDSVESALEDLILGPQPEGKPRSIDDKQNAQRILNVIESLPTSNVGGRGALLRMGDVLDRAVAPLIDGACRNFGYERVDMFLGNFNPRAGSQSKEWGGGLMTGHTIADFMVPKNVVVDRFSKMAANGRVILLRNVINDLIAIMAPEIGGWAQAGASEKIDRPNVALGTRTITDRSTGRSRLVLFIFDRKQNIRTFSNDPTDTTDFIDPSQQTKERVFKKLAEKGVPIVEFGRSESMIIDASFEFTPDPLFQAILVDTAYRDVKDRAAWTGLSDAETRVGKADPAELIPFSTLKGEITMIGNFVLESFGKVWIEFFGASDISGVFHVLEKHDTIVPGKFESRITVQSEGIDPMNTRRKRKIGHGGLSGQSSPGRVER